MEDYFIKPQDGGRTRSRTKSKKTSSARLTPYQRHIKEFAKTYKGKNMMAAAAKAWSGKKPASRKTSRRRSRKHQRGGAESNEDTHHQEISEMYNKGVGMARDDTAALKQILMQRLYGS